MNREVANGPPIYFFNKEYIPENHDNEPEQNEHDK